MIVPAQLAFTPEGTPYSPAHDDIYHSAAGGLDQARHVFLDGNHLIGRNARWRNRRSFVIVETGFGIGLNFLATWQAWRDDAERCERLHFVSFEKHPFSTEDLAALHTRWPELAEYSAALCRQWPALLPGAQRLFFDNERVVLTLFFGDAQILLPRLRARADAFYLDGFSPEKNPELWSPRIWATLGRLAVTGATVATWTVAGAVRRGLSAAGFAVEKAPGFGSKREMTRGSFHVKRAEALLNRDRSAVIIGAGLAGCSIAERLAARGWRVQLIDAASESAAGASGNHAGVIRPQPSLDDNLLARLSRAAFLHAGRHLRTLTDAGLPLRWNASGVLYLARDPSHETIQRQIAANQTGSGGYLQFLECREASAIARWPLPNGGWYFPTGAWVQPPMLCRSNLLRHAGQIEFRPGQKVDRIEHRGDAWQALDETGQSIATAPVMILANAGDGRRLAGGVGETQLPMRIARGQVSYFPSTAQTTTDIVICRDGYLTPPVDGIRCVGASFDVDDQDDQIRLSDHAENLHRLETMLPGHVRGITPEMLGGRVGFRSITRDRMPIVGALADMDTTARTAPITRLDQIPRRKGLYGLLGLGSRGVVWATLAAELLASQIEDEPLPIEGDLVDAVDPGRFLLRRLRRI